jgi:hypothetical protein
MPTQVLQGQNPEYFIPSDQGPSRRQLQLESIAVPSDISTGHYSQIEFTTTQLSGKNLALKVQWGIFVKELQNCLDCTCRPKSLFWVCLKTHNPSHDLHLWIGSVFINWIQISPRRSSELGQVSSSWLVIWLAKLASWIGSTGLMNWSNWPHELVKLASWIGQTGLMNCLKRQEPP